MEVCQGGDSSDYEFFIGKLYWENKNILGDGNWSVDCKLESKSSKVENFHVMSLYKMM